MKIGKSILMGNIKNSIIENGGGVERAEIIAETVIKQLNEIGYRTRFSYARS